MHAGRTVGRQAGLLVVFGGRFRGYILDTVTRLTSTEAQTTIVVRFQVRFSEAASNCVEATIMTIADTQIL
jgi:hypothetical protein